MILKKENAIYLFGKYTQKYKEQAIEVIKKCNIIPYELRHDDNGVQIINLFDNKIIHTYLPDKKWK